MGLRLVLFIAAVASAAAGSWHLPTSACDSCSDFGSESDAFRLCREACASVGDPAGIASVNAYEAVQQAHLARIRSRDHFSLTSSPLAAYGSHPSALRAGSVKSLASVGWIASKCYNAVGNNAGALFVCGMALEVITGLENNLSLGSCVADLWGVLSTIKEGVESVREAIEDAHDWNMSGADHEAKNAFQSLAEGLENLTRAIEDCEGLEELLGKLGSIAVRLSNEVGEAWETFHTLWDSYDLGMHAADIIAHWGDWARVGKDVADMICDLSDAFFSKGC